MSERSQIELPVNEQAQSRAARRLIETVGGIAPAAEFTGKSEAQLSKYSRPNYAESMPISVIEELESLTHGKLGHPHVTSYLAGRAGYVLFKKPEVKANRGDILNLLAVQSKEGGDIANAVCIALANDGEIKGQEIPDIRKEIADLIRVAVTMDAELELMEQDEL
ncbi:phage regulatory CII family protein [Parasphingorhabdus sp.]|uniref:phage regulatory CII family protein n=1 Tax=Parasphingorhabdus sp. TaxID=2709688 RepID=UPI002F93D4FC